MARHIAIFDNPLADPDKNSVFYQTLTQVESRMREPARRRLPIQLQFYLEPAEFPGDPGKLGTRLY